MSQAIHNILDAPSMNLLNELNNDFDISFKKWYKGYSEVFIRNNTAEISYSPIGINADSIAHELLHIWLKRFDYRSSNCLWLAFKSDPFMSRVFDKRLSDHIGNCMDHAKMYPKYLEMGYSPKKFIRNAGKEQSSLRRLQRLSIQSARSHADSNTFIGNLISIYADHMDNDYSKHLTVLKEKNEELFNKVTEFWNNWMAFDIENIDPIYNSDFDLYETFIAEMEDWAVNLKTPA